jgi:hypothetical protein
MESQKIPKSFEALDWVKLFETMGLNEQIGDRLMRLLVVHMLADRLLTGALVLAIGAYGDGGKALEKVAEISFAQRVNLAELCRAISGDIATGLRELNKVRNAFAHYKPARGWDFDGVPELADEAGFRTCAAGGVKALQALMAVVMGREAPMGQLSEGKEQ